MLLNCAIGEDSWESLRLQGDLHFNLKEIILNIHWKDWCWSWSSNTLTIWCEELMHWENILMLGKTEGRRRRGRQRMRWLDGITDGHKFEQGLGVGDGQGSLASCSPWGPRVGHDWVTELNWLIGIIDSLCGTVVQNCKTAKFQIELLKLISLHDLEIVIAWINY